MFKRIHRAWINVDIRIQLLHRDSKTTHLEQTTKRGGSETFAKRTCNTTCYKHMLWHYLLPSLCGALPTGTRYSTTEDKHTLTGANGVNAPDHLLDHEKLSGVRMRNSGQPLRPCRPKACERSLGPDLGLQPRWLRQKSAWTSLSLSP